jgi:hypothetical protein
MKRIAKIGALAAMLTIMAATFASAQAGSSNTIRGCVNRKSRALRIVGPGVLCSKSESSLEWSIQGPAGIRGPSGIDGAQGPAGADGLEGPEGLQGPMGPQGLPGLAGLQGPEGAVGPQGLEGIAGAQGSAGVDGAQGAQGPEGAIGPRGSEGPAGAQGPQGPEGPAGAKGPEGPAGAQGPDGSPGAQGPQGPAGTPGAGMIAGNTGQDNLSSSTKYGTFFGSGLTNSETDAEQILAKGGTARSLYVRASGAPGEGKSWSFVIYKNGSADPVLTCAISGSDTSCSDTAGSISFSAGDTISICIVGTSGAAQNKSASWALEYA